MTFNINKKAPFYDLAVSPDGRILAAIDLAAATIHVFDSENLNLICSPLQIGTPYDRLCFSPNGRYLIAADAQGASLRIFATDTWAHIMTLNSGSNGAVACAREKALMATAKANEITLWDTNSWTVVHSLPTNDISHYLAMSPDGTKLASVVRPDKGLDRIDLWDLRQRRVIRTLPGQFVRDDEIVFSPDGNLLAAGDRHGAVRIWSVRNLFTEGNDEPDPLQKLQASNPSGSLAFSPDGTRLALATSMDSAVFVRDAVQVWDIAAPGSRPIATFQDHSKRVSHVSFVRDANTICTIADDLTLKMWDLSESRSYDVIEGVDWRSGIAYANDGRLIYQDHAEGKIRSWNVTKRESREILDTGSRYSRIGYSANGSFLAAVTHDEQRLRVWNLGDNSQVHTTTLNLEHLKRRIESNGGDSTARGNDAQGRDSDRVIISRLSVSNDGRLVACVVPLVKDAAMPAIVVLINPENGNPIAEARVQTNAEVPPTFSPSSQRLVTTKWIGRFSMLSEVNSDSLHDLFPIPSRGPPTCVAYSPDGGTLAIGNYNNEIRLHAAKDGGVIQILQDHAQWPSSVAFSRDGRHLVSAAPDGRVLIWKRSSNEYQLVSTLRGLPDLDTMYAAIAPGSDSLAVLHGDARSIEPSHEGKIQVWRIASPEEVRHNVDDQLERTIRSHTVDQPNDTLRRLRDILAQDPKELRARTLRGQVYDRIGDWSSAVKDWTEALEQVPDNFHFLESRAKAYELGRKWSAAEDDWNKLIELTKESNGKYLLERGECYLHSNRRHDAHADFVKALTRTASVDSIQRIVSLLALAKTLVPTGSKWRYKTGTQRPPDWNTTSFDDSQWRTGWAPFGAMQRYLPTRTDTGFHDVWLRRTFERDNPIDAPLVLRLRAEEDVEVFINGVSATPTRIVANYLDDYQWSERQWSRYPRLYPVVHCSKQVRLRAGTNVLAVHCRNPDGVQTYVDVGLYVQSDDVDISSMLSEATERAPHNAYLHTALAVCFVEQRKWKYAAEYFHKSAKLLDEKSLPKWMWAALMYRHCGDLKGFMK